MQRLALNLHPRAVLLATALATAACSGGGGGGDSGGGSATLVSITVSAVTSAQIPKALTAAFVATGHYTDGSNRDLTASAAWSVVDGTIAAVVSPGTLKGLKAGATQVRATSGTVQSNLLDVTVLPASLTSVAVTPGGATLASGTRMQYGAVAIFSDGSYLDVTASATWSAAPAGLATVSAAGVALGGTPGAGTIQATYATVVGKAAVTVTNATLSSIAVTPALPIRAVGVPVTFTATGTFSDQTTQDLGVDVTWASSTIGSTVTVATLSGAVATPVAPGAAVVTATRGGVSGASVLRVTAASLASLEVTPASPTVTPGTSVRLAALGHFSDGSIQDLTAAVAWSATPEAIATITPGGLLTGLAVGGATATASYGGLSANASVTVASETLVSIAVTAPSATLPAGLDEAFTATGTFSDGSTQDLTALAGWTSSVTTVAAVSNAAGSAGVVSALGAGSATITAAYGGASGSKAITVAADTLQSITVTPEPATLTTVLAGGTVQYDATGHYLSGRSADLTRSVLWFLSGTAASISNAAGSQGLLTGLSPGPAQVFARFVVPGGTTVTSLGKALTVLAPAPVRIDVTPPSVSLAKGLTQEFTATELLSDGSSVDVTGTATWTTLDPTVATNAGSLVRAVGTSGATKVRASADGLTGQADVAVSPAAPVAITLSPAAYSLAKGTSVQYDAAVIWSDGLKQDVTGDPSTVWTTVPAGLASVTATGWVTGLASGAVTVSATASGLTGSTPLAVTPATLTALAISPTDPSVPDGLPQPFNAIGIFTDGTQEDLTDQVAWDTDNHAVATMDALGVASTHAAGGPINVTASYSGTAGAASGSTTLTVTNATLSTFGIDQGALTLAAGTTSPLTASGTYSDGSIIDLTALSLWTSDATGVAIVSNAAGAEGVVTGVAVGGTNVNAAFEGQTDFAPVTVTSAVLTAVLVSLPAGGSATVPRGMTQPLVATGLFSDGSTQDLTVAAGWTSSVTTVAAVSNAPGSEGVVTGIAQGTSTLTAAYRGLSGTLGVTVSGASIASIDVTPLTTTLPRGYTRQYRATANYSDGSARDVTTQATWRSSSTAAATISNAAGSQGLATGVAAGATNITATLGGKTSANAALTVTNATLSSLAVTPASGWTVTVSAGAQHTLQLTATGTFSDGLRLDVTRQVSWSSSAKKKASVSKTGLVTGIATTGSVTITASKGNGGSKRTGSSTGSVVR